VKDGVHDPKGFFEPMMMLFSLANSPVTFQTIMKKRKYKLNIRKVRFLKVVIRLERVKTVKVVLD